MAKKFKDLIQFYPNAKKGKPEETEGTLDTQNGMPAVVVREQKNDQMEITHKSGRKETAKVHMTGSDYHIVKNKHGQQFTVNKKGHVLHGHGNVNEESDLEESMTDSWKKVQSMDKGSLTGGKEQAKKRLDYLNAVHAHHKKYGNDTKKVKADIESINRSKIAEEAANLAETYAPVAPTIDKKYIKGTPEWKANKEKSKPRVGHPTNKVKEETEMETQLDERNKENATKRKMMDASRGARYKVSGNPVPDRDPQHKTAQAHNKAIGRALRNEEAEEETLQFTQEELQLIEQFIELAEKMNLSKATMGDVIKDFKKSDAPQFAGKSDEKRRQMAIAAKLQADRDAKKEETETPSFSGFVEALKGNQHKIDKNKNGKIDAQDFKMLRKEEAEQVDENAFDWKSKKPEPSSGRYEIKRENGRTIVTRKYNPETGHSTGTDDEPNAPKRGRGRPAGSKNRGSAK